MIKIKKNIKTKFYDGFTIIELLITIVIIGILIAITFVSYNGITQKSKIVLLQSDLKRASDILEMDEFSSSNRKYPATKELANSGNGLIPSQDVVFNYTNISEVNFYCLTATHNDSLSYYISSLISTSVLGKCNDSYILGWGGTGKENGNSVIQTADGGYAVTGITAFGAGGAGADMFIAKYASDGSLTWDKTWGGTNADWGNCIIQTTDGGYMVTGETLSYAGDTSAVFLAKYTSDGTLLWDKTWKRFDNVADNMGVSIIQTTDGGYAVTGYGSDGTSGDVIILKYNADGSLLWDKTWGSTKYDSGTSIYQTADGGYVVTGNFNNGSNDDMFIVKYTSDGTLSWKKTWGGSGTDVGNSITQTNDGGYVVAGYTNTSGFGAGGYDMFIVKYDSAGTLLWNKTWGGTGTEYGKSIAQTIDGGYIVAGQTNTSGFSAGGEDSFIAKYTYDGIITNCSYPMCQSPTATETNPTATETNPTATETNPTAYETNPTATETNPNATETTIVAR